MSTEQVAAANPVEKVRARLDGGRKWYQGASSPTLYGWRTQDSPVCLVGACWSVAGTYVRDESSETIEAVICEQFPDRRASMTDPIPAFNDHPDTVWADVDLVLEKAAIKWDEQVRP